MRQQKIRGFNRRFRDIALWRLENLDLRLDYIEKDSSERTFILVDPWLTIPLINSKIPEPKRKTKRLMLNGLIDIYESWKVQLENLGKPYYLKIWLFEPRFSKSQVVCAVDDSIDLYENDYPKPAIVKQFKPSNYGQLSERLQKFDWDHRIDQDYCDNNFVGEPDLYASRQDYENSIIWFNRLLKQPHRLIKFDEPIGKATESYTFTRGDLWIGGQNK